MIFTCETFTGAGGRPYNEDSIGVWKMQDGLLAIVADGLGRHGGGDIASKTAVDTLSSHCLHNPCMTQEAMLAGFVKANQAVIACQTPACEMKSTAALLLCLEDSAAIAHIGDTRGYHFSNGRTVFQTKDHSVSQLAVLQGEITPTQIRFHEDRSRLLKALGNDTERLGAEFNLMNRLSPGDAILLCSDGFWEYVTEAEMETDLQKSATPGGWLAYMLQRVGRRVNGKHDNLSAIAVFCT